MWRYRGACGCGFTRTTSKREDWLLAGVKLAQKHKGNPRREQTHSLADRVSRPLSPGLTDHTHTDTKHAPSWECRSRPGITRACPVCGPKISLNLAFDADTR